jgi:hypothetical protein
MASDAVQDNFFVDTAWQRIMRAYAVEDPFLGGIFMQVPFMYDRVNGGAYAPGTDVQVVQKQILGAMGFSPRAYKEDIALNLFNLGVINSGPSAAVSLYDMYFENAVTALSTDMNIDAYQHGQAIATGVVQNRSIYMNGMDEALSDGANPGWLGNYYTTYGGQTRNGVVNTALNSVPLWAGDQAGNPGQANWATIVAAYLNCVQPPDTILSNKAAFQYLWSREETKQRFAQETDARIGLTGFHVFDAYYHVDKLAPSTKFGAMLPSGLSQTTSIAPAAFTSPGLTAANIALSNYPASTSCKPGEPVFVLRLKDWKLRPSNDPEYNHNFTPLIRSQTNPDLVTAFYKCAFNYYTPSPRDNVQIVGFGY